MYSGYEYCYGVQEVFTNLYSPRHHKDDTVFCLTFKDVCFI